MTGNLSLVKHTWEGGHGQNGACIDGEIETPRCLNNIVEGR